MSAPVRFVIIDQRWPQEFRLSHIMRPSPFDTHNTAGAEKNSAAAALLAGRLTREKINEAYRFASAIRRAGGWRLEVYP